jgi:hemolysin activation/secretion protein
LNKASLFLFVCLLTAGVSAAYALDEPAPLHFTVSKFEVTGENPLTEAETQSILAKFLGDHYGLEGLQEAADALEREFRAQGFAFYRVTLVPQKLEKGTIKLLVTEFKIESISIKGNQHYSNENIMRNLPTLQKGRAPNTAVLSRAMGMANEQPSKSLKLQFAESETGDGIEARATVKDEAPNFWFASLNNTGTSETGKWRLTGGYQFTNLFDRDQSMSLSYTLSPSDTSAVKQYGIFYKVPFYESGSQFSALIARSDVDSGVVSQNFEVSGAGTIVLLRYVKKLLQNGAYKQEFEFGLDNKLFNNDVLFFGSPQTGTGKVVSRPASVSYNGSWVSAGSSLDFNLGAFMNIAGGSKNEDADYNTLRAGATADWSSLHYGFGYNRVLGTSWFFRFKTSGQQSSDRLISGEQFGIGGIYSVRGFEERTLLGDSGVQANLELWAPGFTGWNIRPLVFIDMGHVETNQQTPGLPDSHDIASTGAGLRWSMDNRLNMVLDVGYVLNGDEYVPAVIEKGDVRGHFDVFYRF